VEQILIIALTPGSAGLRKLTVVYMDRSRFHPNLFGRST